MRLSTCSLHLVMRRDLELAADSNALSMVLNKRLDSGMQNSSLNCSSLASQFLRPMLASSFIKGKMVLPMSWSMLMIFSLLALHLVQLLW